MSAWHYDIGNMWLKGGCHVSYLELPANVGSTLDYVEIGSISI